MLFNEHSRFKDMHSVLSASSHAWLRYSDEKFVTVLNNKQAAMHGTKLHELAHMCIVMNQKLPDNGSTISLFVNDAIGYRMQSEQILFYSPNAFGTADAISIEDVVDESEAHKRGRKRKPRKLLRIHDLKTGVGPTSMDQLKIYAAYFCLEYNENPADLIIELRIYQNGEVRIEEGIADEIRSIMDLIIHFDKIIEERKETGAYIYG